MLPLLREGVYTGHVLSFGITQTLRGIPYYKIKLRLDNGRDFFVCQMHGPKPEINDLYTMFIDTEEYYIMGRHVICNSASRPYNNKYSITYIDKMFYRAVEHYRVKRY